MGIIHIAARNDDKSMRFEEALYDIEEAIAEACDIYDEMKEQFSERSGASEEMSPRMQRRMSGRMNSRNSSYERRGRRM